MLFPAIALRKTGNLALPWLENPVFYMLVEIFLSHFIKPSPKHQEYYNFRCKIRLGLPVGMASSLVGVEAGRTPAAPLAAIHRGGDRFIRPERVIDRKEGNEETLNVATAAKDHGCQMAIASFLDRMCLALPFVCVVSKHVSQFVSLSVCLKSKYNICKMNELHCFILF